MAMAPLSRFLISRSMVAFIRSCKPPRASNLLRTRSATAVLRKRGDGLSTRGWFRGSREIALSGISVLKSCSARQLAPRWPPPPHRGLPQFYRAPFINFPFGPSNSPSTLPACNSIRCSGSAATGLLFPARDGSPFQEAMGLGFWQKTAHLRPPTTPPRPRCFSTLPTGHFPVPLFPWLSTISHSPRQHLRVRPRMKPSPSLLRKTRWRLSVG